MTNNRKRTKRKRYTRSNRLATIFRAIVLEGAGVLVVLTLFVSTQGDLSRSNNSSKPERHALFSRAVNFFKSDAVELSSTKAKSLEKTAPIHAQKTAVDTDPKQSFGIPVNSIPKRFLNSKNTAHKHWTNTRPLH